MTSTVVPSVTMASTPELMNPSRHVCMASGTPSASQYSQSQPR